MVTFNAKEFFKRLDDEDDGDKSGEALLGKPGDILDQGAQVEDHNDQNERRGPESDPHTRRQEIPTIVPM